MMMTITQGAGILIRRIIIRGVMNIQILSGLKMVAILLSLQTLEAEFQ